MKNVLLISFLFLGCATTEEARTFNPDGTPRPLSSEMEEGAHICTNLCRQIGQELREYRADGKCICRPKPGQPKGNTPTTK